MGPRYGVAIALLALYLTLVTLLALATTKRRPVVLALASAATSLILHADLIYFRYFHELPTVHMLGQLATPLILLAALPALLRPEDLLLYLDLPLLLALPRPCGPLDRGIATGLLLLFVGILSWRHSPLAPITTLADPTYHPGWLKFGVLHFHLQDAWNASYLRLTGPPPLAPADWRRLTVRARGPAPPNAFTGVAAGRNLIVIQVESLQGFVIGRSLGSQSITPRLNALLRETLYFPNIHPQIGRGVTADAELLTQQAIYPSRDGVANWQWRSHHFHALPAALQTRGYTTFSFHGFAGSYYNRAQIHRQLGFAHTWFATGNGGADRVGLGLADGALFVKVASTLAGARRPYYAFVITLSSHYPFDSRFPTRAPLALGSLDGTLLGNYLQAIHYADEALGDFLDQLRAQGRLDDTVIVIYGDHHAVPSSDREELARWLGTPVSLPVMKLTQRLPLLIRLPGGKQGIFANTGGQIDVAPTLTNLLGMDEQILRLFGQDLLAGRPHQVVFRDGSWVDGHTLYIAERGSTPPLAYDLLTRQEVPTGTAAAGTARARQELADSDTIADHDLLPALRQVVSQ